jgi:PAS domain S-box-containing protein
VLGASSVILARVYLDLHVDVVDVLIVGCPFALLFQFFRKTLENLLGTYLQRNRLDVKTELRISSTVLARPSTQRATCLYLIEVINRLMSSEWVGVYLSRKIEAESNEIVEWTLVGESGGAPSVFDVNRNGLLAMAKRSDPVARDKLHLEEFRSLGADLLVTLSDGSDLLGLILLGPKSSGDAYFSDDIDLLSTLANQAGVAIRNAQLYEQVALINEHLRNIVATIESGVVAVNDAERVTMFNSAAERLSGLAGDEMVGRPLSDLPVALADSLRVTLGSGLPRVVPEVPLARASSTHPVPVICCTSPLRGPTGGLLGAVAVFSDLTPLKELEMERQRAERLAYFETLAAGIAHEIKNPLVAIKTFLQLLPKRFNDPQFREEFGRVAGREIDRMEHLVARLRSLAKPGGRIHHPVDLRAPVNDALELLQPRLEETAITTQWNPGAQPCLVMGDHAELEQLFLNLFINALEAMAPGGVLTVRLRCREASATVEVEDTGPGIRDDLLGRIFDPFVTTKLHGSGLGLAICSSIASAHRARLRGGNKPGGRGAIFTVELPVGTQVAAPLNA